MFLDPEDILKIVFALLAGGLIGVERELREKAAGFRTMIFICLGAALFTIFSVRLAGDKEPTRIAANVVVGVGFIGAGVILRDVRGRVTGLTTAAAIWLVAALGVGIGGGFYLLSLAAAAVSFVVLWVFPRLEAMLNRFHSEHYYEITTSIDLHHLEALQRIFRECDLKAHPFRQIKSEGKMLSYWIAAGPSRRHDLLMEKLLVNPDVIEFKS